MSLTGIINTHTMCATLVMYHGSDEQKQRLLPSMATGERRGALSLSEPDAGSATKNLSCKAVRAGDEYVQNGTQAWGHNGARASVEPPAARPDGGHSALIAPTSTGLS